MSLSRLALRLSAVEALNPSATLASGPWPTIAGPNVFDSRIDPIETAATREEYEAAITALDTKPILTVYTEDDHAAPYGTDKIWPSRQTVTLVIELMIAARGQVTIEEPNGAGGVTPVTIGSLDAPITDRQHESLLDWLEAQVRYIFNPNNYAPSAVLFRKVALNCVQITSDPQRDSARATRLALRTLKFHFQIAAEVWPAPGSTPASGLSALPAPLAAIAQALPDGSSGLAICTAIAANMPTPTTLTQLTTIAAFGDIGATPSISPPPSTAAIGSTDTLD